MHLIASLFLQITAPEQKFVMKKEVVNINIHETYGTEWNEYDTLKSPVRNQKIHCALHNYTSPIMHTLTRCWHWLAVSCIGITFKPSRTNTDIVCWVLVHFMLTFLSIRTASMATIGWQWRCRGSIWQTWLFIWNNVLSQSTNGT